MISGLQPTPGPSTGPPAEFPARPRFSVVTPTFNHAHFIRRTIDSVLEQRGEFDLEYHVVDAESTDGTQTILQAYEGRLQWTSEADRGQADAINKGLRRCSGDIVGWLNSDDTLLPGALQRIANAFRENRGAEWVHGRCRIIDENDRRIRRPIELYKHWRSQHYSFGSLLAENFISQMSVFWRRQVMDEIGYLDPTLRFAFDYDLWLRLARRCDPIYIHTAQACFRWYEMSKSGAGYIQQFAEDAQVARRYTGGAKWPAVRKDVSRFLIARTYRLLADWRKLRSRG